MESRLTIQTGAQADYSEDNPKSKARYKTAKEFEAAVDSYFSFIEGDFVSEYVETQPCVFTEVRKYRREPEPATITGLALYLGFIDRRSFYDYEYRGVFSHVIKKARLRVEYNYEKRLDTSKNPAGQIFVLKNMGWRDEISLEHTSKEKTIDYSKLSDATLRELSDAGAFSETDDDNNIL